MKVRFTPSARAQFLSAISYIQQDKPSAAVSFRDRAEKTLRRLEVFPIDQSHRDRFDAGDVLFIIDCVPLRPNEFQFRQVFAFIDDGVGGVAGKPLFSDQRVNEQ